MKPFLPLALAIALFAFALPARAGKPLRPDISDPSTTVCRSSKDCVAVTPPCAAPVAVNKPHEKDFTNWYNYIRPSTKCADWILPPKVKSLSCVRNRCAEELEKAVPRDQDPSPFVRDPEYCEHDTDCVAVVLPEDCCYKHYYNMKNADEMRRKLHDEGMLKVCPDIDRRRVTHLRCEKNKCTADLEIPPEIPGAIMAARGRCE